MCFLELGRREESIKYSSRGVERTSWSKVRDDLIRVVVVCKTLKKV